MARLPDCTTLSRQSKHTAISESRLSSPCLNGNFADLGLPPFLYSLVHVVEIVIALSIFAVALIILITVNQGTIEPIHGLYP